MHYLSCKTSLLGDGANGNKFCLDTPIPPKEHICERKQKMVEVPEPFSFILIDKRPKPALEGNISNKFQLILLCGFGGDVITN